MTCPTICRRIAPEPLADLDAALLASLGGPPAESLNAISKRTGIRKPDLIRHRDGCLNATSGGTATEPAGSPSGTGDPECFLEGEPEPSRTTPLARARNGEDPKSFRQVQMVRDVPSLPTQPEGIFNTRAIAIAEVMTKGLWSRKRLREHAAKWGVADDTVREYARGAALLLAADRGQLDQQREVSIAYGTRQRDLVRQSVRRNLKIADQASEVAASDEASYETRLDAMKTETFARKNAVDAGKLEQKWQEHLDKVSGALAPGAPVNLQVNYNSEKFAGTMDAILGVLERHPEVKAEVMEAVAADHARRVTPAK